MVEKRKSYQRDCLLGACGALLMLVGDLCLSVIPASPGDSGLFVREAFLMAPFRPGVCRFCLLRGFAAWRFAFLPCVPAISRFFRNVGKCGRRSGSEV